MPRAKSSSSAKKVKVHSRMVTFNEVPNDDLIRAMKRSEAYFKSGKGKYHKTIESLWADLMS